MGAQVVGCSESYVHLVRTQASEVQISGKIAPLLLFAHTKSGILRRLSALRIFTLQRKTTDQVIYCGNCTQAAIDADYPRHTSPLRPTKVSGGGGFFCQRFFVSETSWTGQRRPFVLGALGARRDGSKSTRSLPTPHPTWA